MLGSTGGLSLWGVPGWLKDSMGVFGNWGVPRSAPLTFGTSLGEDWTELCRSEQLAQRWLFGCSVLGCLVQYGYVSPSQSKTC